MPFFSRGRRRFTPLPRGVPQRNGGPIVSDKVQPSCMFWTPSLDLLSMKKMNCITCLASFLGSAASSFSSFFFSRLAVCTKAIRRGQKGERPFGGSQVIALSVRYLLFLLLLLASQASFFLGQPKTYFQTEWWTGMDCLAIGFGLRNSRKATRVTRPPSD